MVRVQYKGGVGNRCLQYSAGRILAQKHGLRLEAMRPHEGFENAHGIDGREAGEDYIVYDDTNYRQMLTDGPRQALVYCFAQDLDIYRDHREEMQTWFWQPNTTADIHPDDILVHIRRGDFFIDGHTLKMTWVRELLQRLEYRRLYVIGVVDQTSHNLLAEFSPNYTDGDPMGDFKLFKAFRRVIISNSTFSWLGAWLSDCEVWAPVPVSGYFSPSSGQNLRVDDGRYHWIEGVEVE